MGTSNELIAQPHFVCSFSVVIFCGEEYDHDIILIEGAVAMELIAAFEKGQPCPPTKASLKNEKMG